MKYFKTIFTITLAFVSMIALCQTANEPHTNIVAAQFIHKQDLSQQYDIVTHNELSFEKESKASINIYNLSPQGFIIISSINSKILGYSFEHNLDISKVRELLEFLAKTQSLSEKNKADVENQIWGPYVHIMWGQVNCSDNAGHTINVTNLFTPSHYAPGCVAISQSTLLRHYQWPPRGVGVSSYTDNQGSSRGTYTVDCENTEYDWSNALERYRNKSSEDIEREAAGTVAYQSAVSLSMDFEYNGSTSNVNRIPSALAHHFRYTALYKSKSSGSFWTILDSNMVWAKPCVLAVENSSGGGHSVVCDGLKIEDGEYYYHLNMGWWGTSNGWYQIRSGFNAGGYNYILGATMNVIPEPMLEAPVVLDNSPMTQLSWRYPENGHAEAFEVQRSMDGGSWETITSTVTDTTLTIFPTEDHTYDYRARAVVNNGRVYANSWGETVRLIRQYTGIEEQALDQIKVYPSPFNTELNIALDTQQSTPTHVFVYNIHGAKVFEEMARAQEININTSNWKTGLYFIELTNGTATKTIKSLKY